MHFTLNTIHSDILYLVKSFDSKNWKFIFLLCIKINLILAQQRSEVIKKSYELYLPFKIFEAHI